MKQVGHCRLGQGVVGALWVLAMLWSLAPWALAHVPRGATEPVLARRASFARSLAPPIGARTSTSALGNAPMVENLSQSPNALPSACPSRADVAVRAPMATADANSTNAGTYFYCYNDNGGVAGLVNATTGQVAAQYEYGPFGELLRATGPLAFANPFRFSTKYQDDETGLLCYPYRYYSPDLGRWLSRDLLAESGGINLYGFCGNDPINSFDPLGLRVPRTTAEAAETLAIWIQLSQAASGTLSEWLLDVGNKRLLSEYTTLSLAADLTFAELNVYFEAAAQGHFDAQGRILLPGYWYDEGSHVAGEQPGQLPDLPCNTSVTGPPLTAHEASFIYDPYIIAFHPPHNPYRTTEPTLSPLDFTGGFCKGAALKAGMNSTARTFSLGVLKESAVDRIRALAETLVTKRGCRAAKRALRLPATDTTLAGTRTLGYTTPNGNVFLQPGLSRAEQLSTLRHESVHAFFSPRGSGPVATFRQNLGQWGYDNSQLLRFTEEVIAETYGSGSLLQGLRHPFVNGYGITPGGLLLEGGVVGGGIFGAGYLGSQGGN